MKIAFISLGTLGPGAPHWTGQILSRGHNLLFYVPATKYKTHIKSPVKQNISLLVFLWFVRSLFVILRLHDSKRHLHCSSFIAFSTEQRPQYFVSRQDKTSWSAQKSKSNVQNASACKQQKRPCFPLIFLRVNFKKSLIKWWYYKTWSISSQ